MSKRSIKFSVLLASVTAGLSVLFILISLFVDLFAKNEIASDIMYYTRTAFDLIAEYTVLGIVIYAFSRYSPKKAWPSLIIAFSSFTVSLIFQITSTAIFNVATKTDISSSGVFGNIAIDLMFSLLTLFIERIVPCGAIALITVLCTKNGTARISKLISFKNPVQRAMLISSVLIYLVNAIPALYLDIMGIISIGGTQNMYFEDFMLQVILPHISTVIYHFILLYVVYLLVYILCQKYAESAPIKKVNATKSVANELNTIKASNDAVEEK
jgi:hypothetical protein